MSIREWIDRHDLNKSPFDMHRPFPVTHRVGLSCADGAKVTIDMRPDRFVFCSDGGESWELEKRRIANVEKMTETQIQTHLKSRPGMAVLGALTLGLPGTIIGAAMTKEKRSKVSERFMAFDYRDSGGNPATLVFQYDDGKQGNPEWQRPSVFVKDFRKNRSLYAPPESHVL